MPSLPHTRFWPGGLTALRCVASADRASIAVYATINGVAQEVSFVELADAPGEDTSAATRPALPDASARPDPVGVWKLVCLPEPFNGCADILEAVLWTTPPTRTVTPDVVTWAHMQTLLMLKTSGGAAPTGYIG